MDMVRHNYNGMNMSLDSVVVEAMPQHAVSDRFGPRRVAACAKRHKQGPIKLLIVRQPPTILVLHFQQCLSHRVCLWVWLCGAGALARALDLLSFSQ